MTIRFVLLVNRQGQTRLAQYYEYLTIEERRALEGEIVRKCLTRTDQQCSFVEHRNYKIIYRRYASLFFLVGVDGDENELAILEFIHCVVETLDRYFGNVCELDIMFHLEKAHFMLEEMGNQLKVRVPTCKAEVLQLCEAYLKLHCDHVLPFVRQQAVSGALNYIVEFIELAKAEL